MSSVQQLKEMIRQADNIVFFGGAGVSTESGIPDFRSAHGLYNMPSKVPYEEMLSHTYYVRHPEEFFDFYKKVLVYPEAKPNGAHYALARLEQQGKLKAVITQNIDGLHQEAGNKNVLEMHGSVLRNYCVRCGRSYTLEEFLAKDGVPHCDCGGVIKPDVVLYEEPLDGNCMSRAISHIQQADLLIVGGTSLVVYPVAGFIQYLPKNSRLVIINRDATQYDSRADLVIRENIGQVLEEAVD